jgi:hypothetical protein
MPFYICEETFAQCIKANPDDAEGQDGCKNNHNCGTLNATAAEDSSSGSSASSATSATTMSTSASAASGTESGSPGASATPTNAAVAVFQQVPTGAFALVFLAAFKFFLL